MLSIAEFFLLKSVTMTRHEVYIDMYVHALIIIEDVQQQVWPRQTILRGEKSTSMYSVQWLQSRNDFHKYLDSSVSPSPLNPCFVVRDPYGTNRHQKSQPTRRKCIWNCFTLFLLTYLQIFTICTHQKRKKEEKEKEKKLLTESYVPIMLDWKYLYDYLIALCLFASYLFCPGAFLIRTFSLVESYL